eukprot:2238213-Rhodomonas_salina.1
MSIITSHIPPLETRFHSQCITGQGLMYLGFTVLDAHALSFGMEGISSTTTSWRLMVSVASSLAWACLTVATAGWCMHCVSTVFSLHEMSLSTTPCILSRIVINESMDTMTTKPSLR